ERNAYLSVADVLLSSDDSSANEAVETSEPESGGGRKSRTYHSRRRAATENAEPSALPDATADSAPAIGSEMTGQEADAPEDEIGGVDGLESSEEPETLEELATGAVEYSLEDEPSEASAEEVEEPSARGGRPRRVPRRPQLRQQRIRDVLKVGDELLVQVIKGPRSTKGARVSTRISLPGRYLVLMPEGDNLGVSRKIEESHERDRLKKVGEKLRQPGFGLIIRTEAEDKTEQELRQDMEFLLETWRSVLETSKRVKAPALVQQDLTLLYKTIRDVFGSEVDKLTIDDPVEYEKANELLDKLSPKLRGRIQLYDGVQPIFDHFGLEAEIDRLLRRKVFLKSGGSLVIDETEALTVIDVNTSKFVGGSSLAETIVKTNIDAAGELARQLRLRDIGGIIVIDFIDMTSQRDKTAVLKALETALKRDRSRTKISNISPLGLVEMTRKRTGETLAGFMTDDCPYCKGRGHLPSAETVSINLERDLRRVANSHQHARRDAFVVTCHPEVAELIIGADGATIEELEQNLQRAVYVRADEEAHIENYNIEPCDMAEMDKKRQEMRRAQVVDCRITRSLLKEAARCIGWSDGFLID
ncbi:MAG TPA: Rne/Rng family ribonuclease, partial [Chthonomonadales bacterium]|nr:Rne/Rng family ribonuclease [Chthonomonadales bacterium]